MSRDELARELRATLERVALPALAAILPWRLCVRLFWQLARLDYLYRNEVDAAYRCAAAYVPVDAEWKRRARFHLLVDNADYFLTLCRGRGWMRRHLRVSGGEHLDKISGAPLLVTWHWGQGFWALRYLRERGFPAAWLHAPVARELRPGEYVSGFMGRRRIRQVARLSGAAPIPVGGSIAAMRERLLRDQLPVMAMPDAPLRPGQRTLPVQLLGRAAQLAAGVIGMAAAEGIPVHVYTIRVDPRSGRRHMALSPAIGYHDAVSLAQGLADVLSRAVMEDSAAWYVWSFADAFFGSEGAAAEQGRDAAQGG